LQEKKAKASYRLENQTEEEEIHARKEVLPGDAAPYDGKDVFEYEEAPKKGLPAVSIFVGLS